MEVHIAELKAIADKLFKHLEQSGWEVVSIPHDYYWTIPKEMVYDLSKDPSGLTLGQLSFDLSDLKLIEVGEELPLSYGLLCLSSILREIGDQDVY